MKYALSFADIKVLSNNMVEVTINGGVVINLENCEEFDAFLIDRFPDHVGLLINKINDYSHAFEARLHMLSLENIKAIAVITYNKQSSRIVQQLNAERIPDGWNMQEFNGLQFGRDKALKWLEEQLNTVNQEN